MSGAADDFHRLLGEVVPPVPAAWDLAFAVRQARHAGSVVEDQSEGFEAMIFADVGALAWYLANLPFALPDFSIAGTRAALRRLHEENRHGQPLEARQRLFWFRACGG